LVFDQLSRRFQKALLSLGFVMFGFVAVASAQTQQQPVVAPQATTTTTTTNAAATPAKSDLKSSLSELSTLYQSEVDRLQKQQEQAQQLYTDGLISRVEFEKGEQALAEAKAKVDSVAREIAIANQPAPLVVPGLDIAGSSNLAWTTGNSKVDSLIKLYGGQYGVDPYLIYCLMSQESSFMSGAVSPKGAQGLMQLMPDTAARYGVTNPYDVAQNIKGGTRYLKDLLTMFNGRVDLALAGYNAGEGAVMKFGNTVPPYDETRNYVKLILKRYGKKAVS
jgi:soluble lytic murein transglycosylase-like protein